MLQDAARCCTATHCNTLQHTATHCNSLQHTRAGHKRCIHMLLHTATYRNTLHHTATCSNYKRLMSRGCIGSDTLQHTASHCTTLQHTATHCNMLQHTAPHCNTLQHTATHCTRCVTYSCFARVHLGSASGHAMCSVLQCVAVCCSVLYRVNVCFSVLQCVAVCCSALQ